MTKQELIDQINEVQEDIQVTIDEIMNCTDDTIGNLLVLKITQRARQLYLASSVLRLMNQRDSMIQDL